jgi:hypothetical protein
MVAAEGLFDGVLRTEGILLHRPSPTTELVLTLTLARARPRARRCDARSARSVARQG